MYINPRPSLVVFTVDGVSLTIDSKDAKELKKLHPSATIHRLHKRTTKEKVGHGPVVKISVQHYLEASKYVNQKTH